MKEQKTITELLEREGVQFVLALSRTERTKHKELYEAYQKLSKALQDAERNIEVIKRLTEQPEE